MFSFSKVKRLGGCSSVSLRCTRCVSCVHARAVASRTPPQTRDARLQRGRLCAHATERFRLIAASFEPTDSITGSLVSRSGRETVVNKTYVSRDPFLGYELVNKLSDSKKNSWSTSVWISFRRIWEERSFSHFWPSGIEFRRSNTRSNE